MLIVFGGLRELARQIAAVYVRNDLIEQALTEHGMADRSMDDSGYRVAYVIAADNLCIGRTVIADSVNPLSLTREAWREVAKRSGVAVVDVEVICSDRDEHRRRIEARIADIPGLRLPNWKEVVSREYHPWDREHIVVDTARQSIEQNVHFLREAIGEQKE